MLPIANITHWYFLTSLNIFACFAWQHILMQNPKKSNFKIQPPKNTEKFHHNNTRPTWPESPSNIMKIMYGHLWSNVAHFQDVAQNRTPCPKFWKFEIWTFYIKNSKCSILFFWDLRHYLGPKIQQINHWAQNLCQKPDHHSMYQILKKFEQQNTACSKIKGQIQE